MKKGLFLEFVSPFLCPPRNGKERKTKAGIESDWVLDFYGLLLERKKKEKKREKIEKQKSIEYLCDLPYHYGIYVSDMEHMHDCSHARSLACATHSLVG